MADQPPVPQGDLGIEWIDIDGVKLPFVNMKCDCSTHLICTAYSWHTCGNCGVKPEREENT